MPSPSIRRRGHRPRKCTMNTPGNVWCTLADSPPCPPVRRAAAHLPLQCVLCTISPPRLQSHRGRHCDKVCLSALVPSTPRSCRCRHLKHTFATSCSFASSTPSLGYGVANTPCHNHDSMQYHSKHASSPALCHLLAKQSKNIFEGHLGTQWTPLCRSK